MSFLSILDGERFGVLERDLERALLTLLGDLETERRLGLERDLRFERLRECRMCLLGDLDFFLERDTDLLLVLVLDRDLDFRRFLEVDLFRDREREWRLDLEFLVLERDLLLERDLFLDRDLLRDLELRLDLECERLRRERDPERLRLLRSSSVSTVPDIRAWASFTFFIASSISLAFMFSVGILAACGLIIAE